MKKKKLVRWTLVTVTVFIFGAGAYGLYLWNMPHRNVQATPVDYEIEASKLVEEYLADNASANKKYLADDGDSKILLVTGAVWSIEEDMNKQKVVLLKSETDNAGVSCTFTQATNPNAEKLQKGEMVSIKGVIRAGAGYDPDLELYEDVIMEKCDIANK